MTAHDLIDALGAKLSKKYVTVICKSWHSLMRIIAESYDPRAKFEDLLLSDCCMLIVATARRP